MYYITGFIQEAAHQIREHSRVFEDYFHDKMSTAVTFWGTQTVRNNLRLDRVFFTRYMQTVRDALGVVNGYCQMVKNV